VRELRVSTSNQGVWRLLMKSRIVVSLGALARHVSGIFFKPEPKIST